MSSGQDGTRADSPLWVVTSYYNPAGYRRRLQNFHVFRRFLNAPLLVVELAAKSDFALTSSDAEIVLQLAGEDRIWQKERLLNLAFQHLPAHVEYVAWLDCDVVLSDPDWPERAMAQLSRTDGPMQLFETVHHVPPEASEAPTRDALLSARRFLAQRAVATTASDADAYFAARRAERGDDPSRPPKSRVAGGMAWAAHRRDIEACGLYDRAVLGGGDAIFVCGLRGWIPRLVDESGHCEGLLHDALRWSERARDRMGDAIGALPLDMVHLWHGAFEDRNYFGRSRILRAHGYDPATDVTLAPNGTLAWADPDGALARDVAAYFDTRCEDG